MLTILSSITDLIINNNMVRGLFFCNIFNFLHNSYFLYFVCTYKHPESLRKHTGNKIFLFCNICTYKHLEPIGKCTGNKIFLFIVAYV